MTRSTKNKGVKPEYTRFTGGNCSKGERKGVKGTNKVLTIFHIILFLLFRDGVGLKKLVSYKQI